MPGTVLDARESIENKMSNLCPHRGYNHAAKRVVIQRSIKTMS